MTLKETIGAVEEFHNAFGIENNHTPTAQLSEAEILLRYKLMREENEEYLEAAQNGDIVEIAEVFKEIQRSNMSKLDADGKPIYREDGKVLKSELYFKPDIKAILDK